MSYFENEPFTNFGYNFKKHMLERCEDKNFKNNFHILE